MFLEYLINESSVVDEIETNEATVLAEFKKSFSIDSIYNKIVENLNEFIVKDDIVETHASIKEFGKNYTLNYLTTTAKQLSV
jgi:hypothetical protein